MVSTEDSASPSAPDTAPHRPLSEGRLEEIRQRVARKFYDGDPVLMEVADAFIEFRNQRRAGEKQPTPPQRRR